MSAALFSLLRLCVSFTDETTKTTNERHALTPLGLDLGELLSGVVVDFYDWELIWGHSGSVHDG